MGFLTRRSALGWVNLFDRLDPVCGFDPMLANDYPKGNEVAVQDVVVQNDGTWRHSATKYLRQPAFCSALRRLLDELRRERSWQTRRRSTSCASAREAHRASFDGLSESADLAEAKRLVEELRNARDYETMGQLAEAVSRRDPKDPKNRRLYAQYLIDTGKATAAVDLLTRLADVCRRTIPSSPKPRACSAEPTSRSSSMRATRPARARGRPSSRRSPPTAAPTSKTPGRTPGTASTCWRCSPVRDGSGCASRADLNRRRSRGRW